MPILLPELRSAVVAAVQSVTCSVSTPVADVPSSDQSERGVHLQRDSQKLGREYNSPGQC
jgi:hypothetical protein